MVSINTNPNQTSALQLLAKSQTELNEIRSRLATGLKVATAKDNGATWGMAVQAKSTLSGYEVLDTARSHAESLVDVTLSATEVVSDLVGRLNELALAATDPSLSDRARASLDTQFQALKRQIDRTVGQAGFDGINLLDSNGSNFLDYGPGVIDSPSTPAIAWGSPPRTRQEPLAGEPLDLHFGFTGIGQNEAIEGAVKYKLRYFDIGGGVVDLDLAEHTIASAATVGPNLPAYDAAATAVMPAVPDTAYSVEIYAEYVGRYPSPDGDAVDDVISNGAPRADLLAGSEPHLLARWGQRDWTVSKHINLAQPIGFGSIGAIDTSYRYLKEIDAGTEPGSTLSGRLMLSEPGLGVDNAEINATMLYQVFDASSQTWVTKASAPTTTIPYSTPDPVAYLDYNITLPHPAPNEDFSTGRLIALIETRHDGAALLPGGADSAPNSATAIDTVGIVDRYSNQSRSSWSFAEALNQASSLTGVFRPQSSIAGETYSANTDYILRWNDGATWHEQLIGRQSQSNLSADTATATPFRLPLPSPSPMTQAQIMARSTITHDPASGLPPEDHEITLVDWDGATPTNHQQTIPIGVFDNTVPAIDMNPRRLEFPTKIETLDGITGQTTPIREKDTRTVGLMGLQLEATSISTIDAARKAIQYVKAAQARVVAQSNYYAGRAVVFASMRQMESRIADQTRMNLGQMIDADMAKEAARLEAAKVKDSLLVQAISIANKLPNLVLQLFQR